MKNNETPRKVTPTKWSDIKKRIEDRAAQAAADGKTLKIVVASQD